MNKKFRSEAFAEARRAAQKEIDLPVVDDTYMMPVSEYECGMITDYRAGTHALVPVEPTEAIIDRWCAHEALPLKHTTDAQCREFIAGLYRDWLKIATETE